MPKSTGPIALASPAAYFVTTHWSVVLAAGASTDQRERALSQLCQAYWYPVYSYLRRTGAKREEAEDLTQGFFEHFIAKNVASQSDPDRGRFRSFLLASLRNFVADRRRHEQAAKRGGGSRVISLDEIDAEGRHLEEPIDGSNPEQLYERNWAIALLEQAMNALRLEFNAAGKSELFAALQPSLAQESGGASYAQLAGRFNMTERALANVLYRMRQRYRQLLRAEVSHIVGSPDEVEDEIQHLLRVLSVDSGGGAPPPHR